MRECPICQSSRIVRRWKSTGGNGRQWWSGKSYCAACDTLIYASGVEKEGVSTVVSWTPGCPEHGTDPVYQTDLDGKEWVCSVCSRRMEHVGDSIATTWQPRLTQHQRDVCCGGLPHD